MRLEYGFLRVRCVSCHAERLVAFSSKERPSQPGSDEESQTPSRRCAAWAAVKSIVESVLRTKSANFETVAAYLRSDRLNIDAYKGNTVSCRSWDNQLRQPVLLHTYNAVISRAPIHGFLHPTENMDSPGNDQGETHCQL